MKKVSREAIIRGTGLLVPALRAIERKEWKPTEAHMLLLRAFRDLLRRQP